MILQIHFNLNVSVAECQKMPASSVSCWDGER
jgi:hypothetical protein